MKQELNPIYLFKISFKISAMYVGKKQDSGVYTGHVSTWHLIRTACY